MMFKNMPLSKSLECRESSSSVRRFPECNHLQWHSNTTSPLSASVHLSVSSHKEGEKYIYIYIPCSKSITLDPVHTHTHTLHPHLMNSTAVTSHLHIHSCLGLSKGVNKGLCCVRGFWREQLSVPEAMMRKEMKLVSFTKALRGTHSIYLIRRNRPIRCALGLQASFLKHLPGASVCCRMMFG